jgi:hypothetical protein
MASAADESSQRSGFRWPKPSQAFDDGLLYALQRDSSEQKKKLFKLPQQPDVADPALRFQYNPPDARDNSFLTQRGGARTRESTWPETMQMLYAKGFLAAHRRVRLPTGELSFRASARVCHSLQDAPFTNIGITRFPDDERLHGLLLKFYADVADEVKCSEKGKGRHLFFNELAPADNRHRIAFFSITMRLVRQAKELCRAAQEEVAAVIVRIVSRLVCCVSTDNDAQDFVDRNHGGVWPIVTSAIVAISPATIQESRDTEVCFMQMYWPHLLLTKARHMVLCLKIQDDLVAHFGREGRITTPAGLMGRGVFLCLTPWRDAVSATTVREGRMPMLFNQILEVCACPADAGPRCTHVQPPGEKKQQPVPQPQEEEEEGEEEEQPEIKPKTQICKYGLHKNHSFSVVYALKGDGTDDEVHTTFLHRNIQRLFMETSLCLPRAGPADGSDDLKGLPDNYKGVDAGKFQHQHGVADEVDQLEMKWVPVEFDPETQCFLEPGLKDKNKRPIGIAIPFRIFANMLFMPHPLNVCALCAVCCASRTRIAAAPPRVPRHGPGGLEQLSDGRERTAPLLPRVPGPPGAVPQQRAPTAQVVAALHDVREGAAICNAALHLQMRRRPLDVERRLGHALRALVPPPAAVGRTDVPAASRTPHRAPSAARCTLPEHAGEDVGQPGAQDGRRAARLRLQR